MILLTLQKGNRLQNRFDIGAGVNAARNRLLHYQLVEASAALEEEVRVLNAKCKSVSAEIALQGGRLLNVGANLSLLSDQISKISLAALQAGASSKQNEKLADEMEAIDLLLNEATATLRRINTIGKNGCSTGAKG